MRIFLLGADGQLGRHLVSTLPAIAGLTCAPAGLDMTVPSALRSALDRARPDLVVNAAAWTDVDGAETQPERAHAVNAEAVADLARWCALRGAGLVHFSTDFVFDGRKGSPYVEDDEPTPLNVYGRTKLEGERAALAQCDKAVVLRTAWLWSLASKSFVSTILRLARERDTLHVVSDQLGSPTHARALADATASMLRCLQPDLRAGMARAHGIYHAAGSGSCSRYELACAAIELDPRKHEHVVRSVKPVASSQVPSPALRPADSTLHGGRLRERFGLELAPWRQSLAAVLERGAD